MHKTTQELPFFIFIRRDFTPYKDEECLSKLKQKKGKLKIKTTSFPVLKKHFHFFTVGGKWHFLKFFFQFLPFPTTSSSQKTQEKMKEMGENDEKGKKEINYFRMTY